jgi:murein DD-endopeptidase MepM/ murein hydrolase activator NlpD
MAIPVVTLGRSRRAVAAGVAAVAVSMACGCAGDATSTGSASSSAAPTGTASVTAPTATSATTVTTSPIPEGSAGPPTTAAAPRPAVHYTFPVQPLGHVSFGRTHHDYPATDVFARCGDSFVAPTSGVVLEVSRVDRWDPARDAGATRGGLSVTIRGDDGVRYYGSHLRAIAAGVNPGVRVRAGRHLGVVGRTGNARATPCHLHFGISPPCRVAGDWWIRRGEVSPWPYLTSWRGGGQRSPVGDVVRWRRTHGCPRSPGAGDG